MARFLFRAWKLPVMEEDEVSGMKAVVKYGRSRGEVGMRTVPVPEVRPGDVLIEVKAAGICGADIGFGKAKIDEGRSDRCTLRCHHPWAIVTEIVLVGSIEYKVEVPFLALAFRDLVEFDPAVVAAIRLVLGVIRPFELMAKVPLPGGKGSV